MVAAPSVRILLDPAEAEAEKGRRGRYQHAVLFPVIRAAGVQVLVLIVLLHNAVARPEVAFRDHLGFIAVVEAYALGSWLVLRHFYGRWRSINLGYWVVFADLMPFLLAVHATGGPASWIYALLLIRVADQTSAGFRRMLLFAHIVPLLYLALVLYMGFVEGRAVAWPLELAKPVFLYAFALYLTTTAKAAESVRDRLAEAIRVARDSIVALEENQRKLEDQSRQLAEAKQRAEDASQAKSAFLSRASHELRTPMNAVLGFAQLLDQERLPGQQREHVRQIVHGGAHLRALLDDLLDLTGIESGHVPLTLTPLPIAPLMEEVAGMLRPAAEAQGVRLRVEVAAGDGRAVTADRRRLKQVLLNLVSNGVKYNRLGGWVELGCEAGPNATWRIRVKDSGAGIARDKLAHLYRPFDRLGAEQTGVEGTGLGLALSKALVTAMGGDIGLETELGRGSTFWIQLPRAQPIFTRESAAPPPAGRRQAPAEATILYIEDHPANIALVEKILARRAGTRLLTAMTASKGLARVRQAPPDLLLLDLNLPDLPGTEVLRQVRADPTLRDLPVIIVSADAVPEHVEQLLAAGAQAYITKPFDVRAFLATIDRTLEAGALAGAGA
jgi:signal transduction histidine kinase/CheY-like chemotaxis protein